MAGNAGFTPALPEDEISNAGNISNKNQWLKQKRRTYYESVNYVTKRKFNSDEWCFFGQNLLSHNPAIPYQAVGWH